MRRYNQLSRARILLPLVGEGGPRVSEGRMRVDERASGAALIRPGYAGLPSPVSREKETRASSCAREKHMRLSLALLLLAIAAPSQAADLNDYPTSTRADYVFGCMKANGDTRQSLDQCSCSIDVIATILPYERYVAAETVASLEQQTGQIGGMFRNLAQARDALDELRRAQAEAQMRCF